MKIDLFFIEDYFADTRESVVFKLVPEDPIETKFETLSNRV